MPRILHQAMAARRLTPAQILENILDIASDESGDDSEAESEEEVELEGSSDDTSEEEEIDENNSGQGNHMGRDGTQWTVLSRDEGRRGHREQRNIFSERTGPTRICNGIEAPMDAFKLLFDPQIIRHMVSCTNEFAHESQPTWSMNEEEMERFVGLLFLRGVMNQRNFPFEQLWSKETGCPAYNRTMSRDRMREIKKFLRFDHKRDRRRNLRHDKFCMISEVLNRFVDNSQRCYRPGPFLTVDEQLYPTKTRCKWTQYMPNKPDKFGIKFWMLAEVETKFCFSVMPYLGRDESRVTHSLGTHVVMKLLEPLFDKGYNVTVDNFFTSKELAEALLNRRTTITGTIRGNRRELPPPGQLQLYQSVFFKSNDLHLTRYQAKRNKVVHILSTQHRSVNVQPEGKKKPDTIQFYNANKSGVDILDSMCRQLSTRAACRRWPLAVFYNLLDLAGINSFILFRKTTGSRISRREFLFQLSKELRRDVQQNTPEESPTVVLERRVTCRVRASCEKNRTFNLCQSCSKPVCGPCQAMICKKCV